MSRGTAGPLAASHRPRAPDPPSREVAMSALGEAAQGGMARGVGACVKPPVCCRLAFGRPGLS
eukprot:7780493-Alexandrium_andersonii.AAC.1